MKSKIFLLSVMASVAAYAPQVQAQVEFKSKPKTKAAPALIQTTGSLPLTVDPKMPPLPDLDPSDPARLTIREFDSYRGRIFQMEVVNRSQSEILRAIAAAMDVRVNVQPILRTHHYPTRVLRALTLANLLAEAVQSDGDTMMLKSGNAYIFKEKPRYVPQKDLDQLRKSGTVGTAPRLMMKVVPEKDKPIEPNWGVIPFNGRKVYILPVPKRLTPPATP